jgi:glutamyl-tRNA reductase
MDERKQLHLLGVSFRTAPVAIREALSFNPVESADMLHAAQAAVPRLEFMVLSTCNRTEFCFAAPAASHAVEGVLGVLRAIRPNAPVLRDDCHRYLLKGVEAVRHLFSVAAGLDSAILGDTQILGQVKEAMSVAANAGSLGATLHQTLVQAIQVGKRARTETRIGYGAASIGSAIASMLAEHEVELRSGSITPRVLIIGAGEMARDIGRHVAKGNYRQVTFINRSPDKAAQLARHCGGKALDWTSLHQALAGHHFVIAATSCPKPILTREGLRAADRANGSTVRLIIDAGMPRNVETGSLIRTIDIDAIRERQELALAQRKSAVPQVEQIVQETAREWERWMASRVVEARIKSLYATAAHASRLSSHERAGFDAPSCDVIEASIHRLLRRSLRDEVRQSRQRRKEDRPMAATVSP